MPDVEGALSLVCPSCTHGENAHDRERKERRYCRACGWWCLTLKAVTSATQPEADHA